MQKVILIRFGQLPDPRVSIALKRHIVGKAVALPVPGAIMSVFNTNSSMSDIANDVKEVGVFFTLSDWQTSCVCLPTELSVAIEKAFGEQPAPTATPKQWTLDELLDLISQNGIESLTTEQRNQLENLHYD
jgi:hypothetical protein